MNTISLSVWKKYYKNKDNITLRNKIISFYMPYANHISNRLSYNYCNNLFTKDDLLSVCYEGLIIAVETYDHTRSSFKTHSYIKMVGKVKDYMKSIIKNSSQVKSNYSFKTLLDHLSNIQINIDDTPPDQIQSRSNVEKEFIKKCDIDLIYNAIQRLPKLHKEYVKYRFKIDCEVKPQALRLLTQNQMTAIKKQALSWLYMIILLIYNQVKIKRKNLKKTVTKNNKKINFVDTILDKNNITIKEFAKELDVSLWHVYKWRNSTYYPSNKMIDRISDIFNYQLEKRLTQETISKQLGLSRPTIAHYEDGRRKPNKAYLKYITKELK